MTETPAAESAAETKSAAETASASALQGMATELRAFGQQLTAALRAAAATPEAEHLSGQIRDGLGQLRDEIDSAIDTLRTKTAERTSEGTTSMIAQARSELSNALQALSRAVVKLADSVAPGETPAKPAASDGSGDAPAA